MDISLNKIYSGKVRDLYEIDAKTMLIVASDRLSAFDVILDQPIVGKGEILTQISNFWFNKLSHIMPNHFTGQTVFDVLPENQAASIEKRAVVTKRLTPVKVEAVVRGYLSGSGWKEYQKTGAVCGIRLPENLREAEKLPQAIFTPSTKAEVGDHDENITFEQCVEIIGKDLAEQVRAKAIQLYTEAAEYALTRGIIIADTKFEFGLDENGVLTLMDEVLTPIPAVFGRWQLMKWAKIPHLLTSNLCAIGWNKAVGTNSHLHPKCQMMCWQKRLKNIRKRWLF